MCIPTEDGGTYHGFETPLCLPYSALPWILARYTDTRNPSPGDYRQSSLSSSPSAPGTLCASNRQMQIHQQIPVSGVLPHFFQYHPAHLILLLRGACQTARPVNPAHCEGKKKKEIDIVQLSFLLVNS